MAPLDLLLGDTQVAAVVGLEVDEDTGDLSASVVGGGGMLSAPRSPSNRGRHPDTVAPARCDRARLLEPVLTPPDRSTEGSPMALELELEVVQSAPLSAEDIRGLLSD